MSMSMSMSMIIHPVVLVLVLVLVLILLLGPESGVAYRRAGRGVSRNQRRSRTGMEGGGVLYPTTAVCVGA
jgi:hypothetical protein